jgi:sec-independent protein translocase protein TatC
MPLVVASTTLFILGAAFGYLVIFRFAFPFFLAIVEGQAEAVISIAAYLSTATHMLLAFGICFQLPVAAYFLARVGLIDAIDMREGFKFAIVAMFVISALITPPDVLTQVLMAGPLLSLYGVGMLVAKLSSTKERVDTTDGAEATE